MGPIVLDSAKHPIVLIHPHHRFITHGPTVAVMIWEKRKAPALGAGARGAVKWILSVDTVSGDRGELRTESLEFGE